MKDISKYLEERFGLPGDHISHFSKHKLEELQQTIKELIKAKYPHVHGRLLGNMSKALPHDLFLELLQISTKKPKVHIAVQLQGVEGLRVGDTVTIKRPDLDFSNHEIHIYNHKEDRWYVLPLNPALEAEIKEFISNHDQEITDHADFVLYSGVRSEHISQNWLRNQEAKMLEKICRPVYEHSKDGRNLHLYSSHSLRGHAATQAWEKSDHQLQVVQELLDHSPSSADTTMLYLERKRKDLRKVLK